MLSQKHLGHPDDIQQQQKAQQIQAAKSQYEMICPMQSYKICHLEIGKHLWWHDGLGHGGGCHLATMSVSNHDSYGLWTHWCNCDSFDTILGTFLTKCCGERYEAHLRCTVVRLSEVTWHRHAVNSWVNSIQQQDHNTPYRPAALAVLTTRPNFCFRK